MYDDAEEIMDNQDVQFLNEIQEDISDTIRNFRNRSKLEKSRLWKNRPHKYYEDKKNKKNKKKKGGENHLKYQPIKKKYSNTEKLLKIFPTKRVSELKIILLVIAILIILILGLLFFMYLKHKKII